ncbi:MAG: flagellar basal body-associated protein [Acidobacteriaceae bacterium]|nr:flagellar basal body-associated protein [Acidobacteriaceae bacterium]
MTRSVDPIEAPEAASSAQPKSLMLPLVLTVFVAIVGSALALGWGGYYMLKTGRLSLPGQGNAMVASKMDAVVEPATHVLTLEPLVVNLADEGGRAYLRLSLTLRIADLSVAKTALPKEEKPKGAKGASEDEVSVRDIAIQVLGNQTAVGLLASDGKQKLKADLKSSIAKQHPEIALYDIYFTEFLVQR